MGFDQWMEQALYHPQHGFYSSGGQAGRRGKDFLTSPEVGPLFGAVLANAIDGCWNELGQPDPFIVIEAGAGRGALAASVLRAKPACFEAMRYVMVERSEMLRSQQQETLRVVAANNDGKIISLQKLPECIPRSKPFAPFGMVIANELLDNLPFRILERTASGWEEVVVRLSENSENDEFASEATGGISGLPSAVGAELGNGEFTSEAISYRDSKLAATLAPNAPIGARIPLQEQASAWVRQACELIGRGRVIVFDYGATTSELAERDGWLRTYTKHGKGTSPLACPGQQDITSDVAFDQLPPPASIQTQADFLQDWSIQSLVAEGQQEWQQNAANPTTKALIARSRPTEAQTLCDPTTFGSYKVAQWIIG